MSTATCGAWLVDVDGGVMLPRLQQFVVHQDPDHAWWLKHPDPDYLRRLAQFELPFEPTENCWPTAAGIRPTSVQQASETSARSVI
ncbi:hypothetical protein [Nonomuraea dietziae]|uniref:hypothetical protein n=1 Tax=Nonomuraea dietziae TaxID=65515 RepID=UPI0031DB8B15